MSSGLTTIPTDLFKYNTAVTDFVDTTYLSDGIFRSCASLTTIPAGLFDYNTAVTHFNWAFGYSGITAIPANLFKYNTAVTSFDYTFYECDYAVFNIQIFYTTGDEATRFFNKSVDFSECFNRSSWSGGGSPGTAPNLWDCNFGSGTPGRSGCFGGGGNTSLTNYASIPANWK
jgi:hypothetical protein